MRLLPRNTGLGWTPFLWLIYLFYLVVFPFVGDKSAGVWVLTAAAAAIFLPLYFYGYWVSGTRLLLVIVTIVLLGAIVTPWNPGATVFFIYGAAFLGDTGAPRQATRRLAILLALMMVEAWWLGWPAQMRRSPRSILLSPVRGRWLMARQSLPVMCSAP